METKEISDRYVASYDLEFGDILEIEGVEIPPFVYKIGKSSRNKRKQLEQFQLIYDDMRPSLSTGKPLTQEEAAREALAIDICKRFSILEEERPVIETMAYSDKIYKELGRDKVNKFNKEITMLNHSKAELVGVLKDVLLVGRGFLYTCGSILNTKDRIMSTFDGICHQTFRAAKTSLRTEESDSDDEVEYAIQRNKFGAPIYGPKSAQYLNCNNPMDRSLALQAVLNPFRKVCVWKKVVSFLGSLPVPLQRVDWKPVYTGCFNREEDSDGKWHAKIRLTDPYRNNYDQGYVTKKTSRSELCHEFYSTYEFDKVCAGDELRTKKIIKFRLCERTFNWTLLEFAKRLGLYRSEEIKEEGFDVNQNGYANVAWLIARWMKGAGTQKDSMTCYLDTTTLRELIDSEGRLIPEVPEPGVPRVAIPRPPRASMQDLYDRMGSMEIRQGAIERMSYRQSCHWDSMTSIINSTHLSSSSQMMMSSVEMTRRMNAGIAIIMKCEGCKLLSLFEVHGLKLNERSGDADLSKDISGPESPPELQMSHPAKAETRGVTSWISSQHNGVNNRESLHA
ncbi:hypothetical protein Tco_0439893 [Tanacetum coccineum]